MNLWKVGALMLVPALLAACGGEDSSMQTPDPAPSLIYSYPADGQRDVSPRADLVLRFSQPVDQPELALKAGDKRIDHELTPVDGGQSWVIHPVAALKPAATYSVSLQRPVRAGDAIVEQLDSDGSLEFQTRGSFSGIPSFSGTAADFGVEGRSPDGERYPLVDFSTLRLTFSQPIHPAGVVYGESVRLEDSAGKLVPARVLSGERHLVIDPVAEKDAAEFDLNPGETYRLVVRDLPNAYGDQLANYETTLTPQDSGPGEILYQAAVANSDAEDLRSVLNGEPINGIALSSVLLGNTPTSYQTGEVWAELAYAPDYPEMTPLQIPAGTLLSSTSLDVNADGVIQCGIVDETDSDGVVIRKVYERDCTEAPDVTLDDAGRPLAPPQATRVVSRNREEARVGCNRDRKDIGSPWIETECPELQFIYMTGALNTEVVGPVDPDDPAAGIRVLLHPTLLTTTSLTVHAKVGTDLTWAETPTGPQIIRMRYAEDEEGKRTRLIPGVIRTGDDGFPVFETDVKIYLDAPDLATPLDLPHNLHSVPLDLDLAGEVRFLDDGRQVIEQYNQVTQTLAVDVGGIVAFDLEIPANGLRLSYLSSPVKPMIGVNSARCFMLSRKRRLFEFSDGVWFSGHRR